MTDETRPVEGPGYWIEVHPSGWPHRRIPTEQPITDGWEAAWVSWDGPGPVPPIAGWRMAEIGAQTALLAAANHLAEIFAANDSVDLLPWLRERAARVGLERSEDVHKTIEAIARGLRHG